MTLARMKQMLAVIVWMLLLGIANEAAAQNSNMSRLINDEAEPESGERLYVQTDKPSYLAGEIIWFKVNYMQAGSWQPLDLSRIAYVELLDRQSKAVVQAKIRIDKRGGSGSLYLPSSIASDKYILRAYTRWMRNAGSSQYFETPVTVINTVSATASIPSAVSAPKMHIYPEGGQLLAGVRSVLGFRLADGNGLPLDQSGVIVNAAGDTVSEFKTLRYGIGRFELEAAAEESYTAHWTVGEQHFSQVLPRASKSGYGLKVVQNGNARFDVEIFLRGLDQPAELLSLVVHANQQVKLAQQMSVANNQNGHFSIERASLAEGVNFVTLFDKRGQPVCERLIFVRPTMDPFITVSATQSEYATRSRVDIELDGLLKTGQANDSMNLSVSVYQSAPWDEPYVAGMASQRWLLPALQGDVQSPEYYFSNDADVDRATDNLLLTHGWRSFDNKPARKSAMLVPELKGHIVTGRVLRKSDDSPVRGELCYLSAPGYPFDLESARSDGQGWVYFEIDNYYGPGEIVVKAASDSARFFRVDISSPFVTETLHETYSPLRLSAAWAEELQKRSVAMQALNIYRADSLRRFRAPLPADTLPFYGKPEYTYRLDDYKRFTTMEEVLREFVAPVGVVNRGGKQYLSIIDELYKRSYDENVMVLIDGIPLTDHNKIFSYDPLKVKKLDIVTRRYVLGSANVGGVASFETFNGRFDAFELDPAVLLIDYEGLQLQRSFYAPDYSVSNDRRMPDFRTTLYWNPTVVSETGGSTKLSFYTGDQKGSFRIRVEGITDSGKLVSAEKNIIVK